MDLVLGVDTGGTYTDGVLLNLSDKQVVNKAKALTTHYDLVIGIRNCLNNLELGNCGNIRLVSLSTTLATNAIVEGRGSEVGLLLIGQELEGDLPARHFATLQGGHDIYGNPVMDLNEDEIKRAIAQFRGKVDAVAISGYCSVRNPEHELTVRAFVRQILDVPVICGHQLSTALGYRERTTTAVLNAQLIPVITRLITSIKSVLADFNIMAPLMIVKGDGTLMSQELALEKPIDTILSGPAASLVGATFLTGCSDALVVDMGGTTTDIAVLKNGIPRVNEEGATVGGWVSRIQAADIYTYGLGGDSYIKLTKDRNLVIGPQRVTPLALLAEENPYLIEELEDIVREGLISPFSQPTDCYSLVKDKVSESLSSAEQCIVESLRKGPHSLFTIAKITDQAPYFIKLQHLVDGGILTRASLTPTDLLHARGSFNMWNTKAANLGVEIMAQRAGLDPKEFLEKALENMTGDLCLYIIQTLLAHQGSSLKLQEFLGEKSLMNAMFFPPSETLLAFAAKMSIPLVAIGAPAKAYLPKVSEKFHANLIRPDHAEVANAVGAAAGKVVEKVTALIRPSRLGGYNFYGPSERKLFQEMDEAKSYAFRQLKHLTSLAAEKAGAVNFEVMIDCQDQYISASTSSKKELYLESRIESLAVGRPHWRIAD